MRCECYNKFDRIFRAHSRSFQRPSEVGEWLSLVEHLVRDQGVGGSNPLSPTNPFRSGPDTWVTECTGYMGDKPGAERVVEWFHNP